MRASVLSLCLLLCLGLAHGHGGGLHRWTFNPDVLNGVPTADVRNDVNVKIATCNSWTALNLTALTPSSFTLPWFPAQLNMTVSGVVDVHAYLSNNCTSSVNAGLFPYLNFTVWIRSGENTWVPRPAPATISASGYGFEGTCSAPGNLYRNNVTLQDNRFNLAFWGYEHQVGTGMNASDTYPGLLWGSAPNSWLFRNATSPNRMRSIIVFAQSGPAFCCNVNYTGFPSGESVLSMGHYCATPATHGRRLFH